MPKDGYITARVDKRLKGKADKVLRRVGITTTDAVTMLLHQIVLRNGLPFDVRIPGTETINAMAELDAGKGELFDGTAEQLFEHILTPRAKRPA